MLVELSGTRPAFGLSRWGLGPCLDGTSRRAFGEQIESQESAHLWKRLVSYTDQEEEDSL